MNDDAELLRRYAEEDAEPAFTQLVHRHVNLVYGAALRRTGGDPHRAADVAQQVFTTLAREARKLSRHTVLAAWLHTATRNAALNLMISEQRRQTRETEAVALADADRGMNPDWDRLRPMLDAAIDELPEADRAAVVLRFLDRWPFAEIGAALQVSEDAARMRTDRALDKLRSALARRGITSTAAALGAIVSTQPLFSAPAGLAAALATQSLATAGAGFSAVTLVSFMNIKNATIAVLGVLIAFGAGTYVGHIPGSVRPLSPAAAVNTTQGPVIASLRQDNQLLTAEVDRLKADLAHLDTLNAALVAQLAAPPPSAPKPKPVTLGMSVGQRQRAMLNNLRQIDAARQYFEKVNGHSAGSIHELVGAKSLIKAVRTVAGEDYAALSMDSKQPLTVTSPDGTVVTYDPTGANTTRPDWSPEELRVQELGQKLQPSAKKAMEGYRAAHNGEAPPNEEAILPYFSTPAEGADYVEFMEAQKAAGM